MNTLESRITRLEASRPQPVGRLYDLYPWMPPGSSAESEFAAAALDALCCIYEVTREEHFARLATDAMLADFAATLEADPTARWERLSDFEYVMESGERRINDYLDRVGHRGPRDFPTETQRRCWQEECDQLGRRLLRPLPPGVVRTEPRIRVP